MIGKRFRSLPFIFANDNYTLSIKQLCSYKGVEIIEGHLMPDHIHMLVSNPPKMSVSSFMGYLKGKSALMMFDRYANLLGFYDLAIAYQSLHINYCNRCVPNGIHSGVREQRLITAFYSINLYFALIFLLPNIG